MVPRLFLCRREDSSGMSSLSKKSLKPNAKLRPSSLLGGHRGREPNKFQFDILVDSVVGGSKTEYSIKWCRGVKTASTKPFEADPKSKDGVAVKQKLSLLCTLYRAKATELHDFEPKDSKISLISHKGGKKNEKTVGKIHFNLSDFVGIPSATTPHCFELNSKTTVNVTITCTFVRVSRGTASSCGSGLSGMTVSSGEFEGDKHGNDDFADLDDVPSPAAPDMLSPESSVIDSPASSSAKSPTAGVSLGANSRGPFTYADENTPLHIFSSASPTAVEKTPVRSMSGRIQSIRSSAASSTKHKAKAAALSSEVEQLQHSLAESRKETEKVRVLHQMSEDIIRELREKIEYSNGSSNSADATRVCELQKKIDDLEKKLATGSIETKQMKEGFETRIVALNTQVETMERAKLRLDGDNKAVREQLAALEKSLAAAAKASGNGSSEEAEVRQKLVSDSANLRRENERLAREQETKSQEIEQLRKTNSEKSCDLERLHEKLDAHEQHALQVKDTYEELSKMYTDLREEHTTLHAEMKQLRKSAKGAASSNSSPRSSSFVDKTRLRRRTHKDKSGKGGADDAADSEADSENLEKEVADAKAELQEKKVMLVNAERAKNDAEKQVANLESDLVAAEQRILNLRKEAEQLTERLEMAKSKQMQADEQHEAAMQASLEHKVEMERAKKEYQAELQQMRAERMEETRKMRQAALQSAAISSGGNEDERIRNLEESLAEAATREDQYEEEILKMTQIMDGLTNKLTETKALVDASTPAGGAGNATATATGMAAAASAAMAAHQETICKHCNGAKDVANDGGLDKKDGAPVPKRTRTGGGIGRFLSSKRVGGDGTVSGETSTGGFISSSEIRGMNLFEKITDGRLLNMLVETKMKLAVSEEEKLALEHLIRRVRAGDKHVQNKLAEHASRLEVKLNQANRLLTNLQEQDAPHDDGTRGKREALRQFNPSVAPTVVGIGPPEEELREKPGHTRAASPPPKSESGHESDGSRSQQGSEYASDSDMGSRSDSDSQRDSFSSGRSSARSASS